MPGAEKVINSPDQLLSPWSIKGATPDADGEVNVQRMSMAISAEIALWYGDRLNALSDEMKDDSQMMLDMTKALDEWEVSNSSGSNFASRQTAMTEWGVTTPVPPTTVANGASKITPTSTLTGVEVLYPAIRATGANWNTMTDGDRYTYVASNGITYDVGITAGQLYLADGGVYFFRQDGKNYKVTNPVPTPSQFQMDAWKEEIQQLAESKSQASLPKQVFMQELLARRSMFTDWCANLIQADERKEDIVGRF